MEDESDYLLLLLETDGELFHKQTIGIMLKKTIIAITVKVKLIVLLSARIPAKGSVIARKRVERAVEMERTDARYFEGISLFKYVLNKGLRTVQKKVSKSGQ
ncbi:MAG: hypothetical protein ACFFCZ_03875 [Promethearchaeota archaeon]